MFQIKKEHCPTTNGDCFLKHNVTVNHRKKGKNVSYNHAIFYTKEGENQLKKAKVVYLDGTFKCVSKPYTQLLTAHVMVETECGTRKQYPHLFVAMTRRKKKDYKAVNDRYTHIFYKKN